MLVLALVSLGLAGSAFASPNAGRSTYGQVARSSEAKSKAMSKSKAYMSMGWFASWHADEFPPSKVSWKKYTNVMYSFGLTTPDVNFINITDPDVFKKFVSTAHAHKVNATLSLGGWTGSRFFSSAVATPQNRTAFVNTMTKLVTEHKLDGLDFDWERPGAAGIGCNVNSPNDTSNFLEFLTELRKALPYKTISTTTSIVPFLSADLTPLTDVSGFAKVLDYITVLNYDVWGPWMNAVGPNAPLNDTCAPSQVGSAVSAVKSWTTAGMPVSKIALGVPAYGRSYLVPSANALNSNGTIDPYPAFNASAQPSGDKWDPVPPAGQVDVCGNLDRTGGTWRFWALIDAGKLTKKGKVNVRTGNQYHFDECSQTPYLYNNETNIMYSYDDAASYAAKGKFVKSFGLAGFSMWEIAGDYNDILLDSIRSASGFSKHGRSEDSI